MAQALYRKYRSRSFADVIGQEHVTKTLDKAVKTGKISHAYLLSGPRGVGKTSVARILAHEVNGLAYENDAYHIDIIEIDAASNRRIDEIRDLREKVHIAPTSAKYKVYIIDEVHMLTREAFNALLKTLEEPPEHCIFILATTEPHKLPETIISRTQRHNFKPVSPDAVAGHLANIDNTEKISIDAGALQLLAAHGEGSFRDSISMLDQLAGSGKKITAAMVSDMLGMAPQTAVEQCLKFVFGGSLAELAAQLKLFHETGINSSILAKQMAEHLRNLLHQGKASPETIALHKNLLEVSASPNPEELLEIILFSAAQQNTPGQETTAVTEPAAENLIAAEIKPAETAQITETVTARLEPAAFPELAAETNAAGQAEFTLDNWSDVLREVKKSAASLYTALRLAVPAIENNKLILSFQFGLHQKKVDQLKHKQLIKKVVAELGFKPPNIECIVDKSIGTFIAPSENAEPVAEQLDSPDTSETANSISNIFGTVEVLES